MERMAILLNSRSKVQSFNEIASRYDGSFELRSGGFTANGKSLMGIFTLDLMSHLTLTIRANEEDMPEILREVAPYRVPERFF